MFLSGNSLWVGLLIFVLLLIIVIRFIWPAHYLFISRDKQVKQLSIKLMSLFVMGLLAGWAVLAGAISLDVDRMLSLAVLALTGILWGVLVWWKIPQWTNLNNNDKSDAGTFETMLDKIDLLYDLKYQQERWLEDEKYSKLGENLLKDDKSRKYIMGMVSTIIFTFGLFMIYDIYVINKNLPLLILPGIIGIILGPMIFAINRYFAKKIKNFGHLLLQRAES